MALNTQYQKKFLRFRGTFGMTKPPVAPASPQLFDTSFTGE